MRRIGFALFMLVLGLVNSGCSDSDADGAASATTIRTTTSKPRATTATATPEEKIDRAVRRFDEGDIPHQGREWIADRADEVCADWDEMGSSHGFTYAVLKQTMNFRPVDDKAAVAVVILTQMQCPQWAIYIN